MLIFKCRGNFPVQLLTALPELLSDFGCCICRHLQGKLLFLGLWNYKSTRLNNFFQYVYFVSHGTPQSFHLQNVWSFLHTQPRCYSNSHLMMGLLCFACLFWFAVLFFFSTYQKHAEIPTRCTTTASNLLIRAFSLALLTCNSEDLLMGSRATPILRNFYWNEDSVVSKQKLTFCTRELVALSKTLFPYKDL